MQLIQQWFDGLKANLTGATFYRSNLRKPIYQNSNTGDEKMQQ
jgi:hypothetical protein